MSDTPYIRITADGPTSANAKAEIIKGKEVLDISQVVTEARIKISTGRDNQVNLSFAVTRETEILGTVGETTLLVLAQILKWHGYNVEKIKDEKA